MLRDVKSKASQGDSKSPQLANKIPQNTLDLLGNIFFRES